MNRPRVSIVVPSRHRPEKLAICLTALRQLYYRPVEIIVVCDPDTLDRVGTNRPERGVRFAACAAPNISAARNIGITLSAGEIVAFIDDDSVAEPAWLDHLIAPFADPSVGAAVGYVRGRNGISFQSRSDCIDAQGWTVPAAPDAPPGFVPKLVGTNMAIRRSAAVALGGFDEAFRFYLEDADMSLRIAAAGHRTVWVPAAEVHHSFAPSSRRTAARTPLDLSDIARSRAIFLRKHDPSGNIDAILQWMRDDERGRLIEHMVRGHCEPRDVRARIAGFDAGVAQGRDAPFGLNRRFPPQGRFLSVTPFGRGDGDHRVIAARPAGYRRARAAAAAASGKGHRASVFLFSLTGLFHRVRFDPAGFWVQRGGVYGRSVRSGRLFRPARFSARVLSELHRIRHARLRDFRPQDAKPVRKFPQTAYSLTDGGRSRNTDTARRRTKKEIVDA